MPDKSFTKLDKPMSQRTEMYVLAYGDGCERWLTDAVDFLVRSSITPLEEETQLE